MAIATTPAALSSAVARHSSTAQAQMEGQESFNLGSCHHVLPLLPKCKALSCTSKRFSRCSSSPFLPIRAFSATQESTKERSTDKAVWTRVFQQELAQLVFACTSKGLSWVNQYYNAKVIKCHFLVANAKFMLDEEEHFQELMRERLRNFAERNREQDFWLAIEPKFLENFPDITKRLERPAVALVSTDELWITFMKLRLDRVLRGEIEAETLTEALKSNPVEIHFEKPQTWTAPYPKYEGPWWTPFLPSQEED